MSAARTAASLCSIASTSGEGPDRAGRRSGGLAPAEARCPDGHLRAGERKIQSRLDQGRLDRVTPAHQAFVQAVQAPDVLEMLAGAAQRVIETEIGAIDRLRLLDVSL